MQHNCIIVCVTRHDYAYDVPVVVRCHRTLQAVPFVCRYPYLQDKFSQRSKYTETRSRVTRQIGQGLSG